MKHPPRLLGMLTALGCASLSACTASDDPASTGESLTSEEPGRSDSDIATGGNTSTAGDSDNSSATGGDGGSHSAEEDPSTDVVGPGEDTAPVEPTPTPPSTTVGTHGVTRGELLFSDDFERSDPLQNGWSSGYENGVWTIEDGVLTALGTLEHSATLNNRMEWTTGIFEFDVNHGGGRNFAFISNGAGGHSLSVLFGRGNNQVVIKEDTINHINERVAWPTMDQDTWYRVTIIVSRDVVEVLLDGESVWALDVPGVGTSPRHLFQIRNHQDELTVSFDNFEYWEVIE